MAILAALSCGVVCWNRLASLLQVELWGEAGRAWARKVAAPPSLARNAVSHPNTNCAEMDLVQTVRKEGSR
jgi:hypothetical protein